MTSVVKCPHCGGETKPRKVCEKCGKDLGPPKAMEIQFKDFKVSELLDIKVGQQLPSEKKVEITGSDLAAEETGKKNISSGKRVGGEKRLWLVMIAVSLVLAAAVLFFLLKFFLRF